MNRFDYLYYKMELSHETISRFPEALTYSLDHIHCRHQFLKFLKRNQYDPCQPNYVSPYDLLSKTTEEFCEKVSKAPVKIYKSFLKTL